MVNPRSDHLQQLSRRQFLSLAGKGLLAALLAELSLPLGRGEAASPAQYNLPCMGRVLEQETILRSEPDERSTRLGVLKKDDLVEIEQVTLGEGGSHPNRVWYGLKGGGFIHSIQMQPVESRLNPVERFIAKPGFPVEVTVPFTDTIWDHRLPDKVAYRLYYGAVVWVTSVAVDQQNRLWYYLSDEWTTNVTYYGKPEHFHIVTAAEIAPITPGLALAQKRIEVRLKEQIMVAYEAERPVFMSRVSTGTAFGSNTFYTPPGLYYTNGKFPSRHMTHPDRLDVNAYDLPGVPWACYITSNGIAFHGTYWHNDFGRIRSHGCINLNLDAAKWVYRWTLPSAPVQERIWLSNAATRVDILA